MLEDIKQIIADNSGVDPEEITADSRLRADLGLNSLDLVMVATELEGKFSTNVSEKDIMDVVTVGDIAVLIENAKK